MNESEGMVAVKIARQTIEAWVRSGEKYEPGDCPEVFEEKMGVFVTIHTYPEKDLRGCIGFVEPVFPLKKAIVEAAIAATHDPRFPELEAKELGKIIIEVSVLTKPEIIEVNDPKEYPKKIVIGRDGLIVKKGMNSGLLLPGVATEHKLDEESFLTHTCMKANLPSDAWLDKDTDVLRFHSQVFSEKKPGS